MQGVDEQNPPNIPLFDKTKYRYPISKRASNSDNISNIGIYIYLSFLFNILLLIYIFIF